MLSAEILNAYAASRRPATDTSVLCHAPFVSLNFEQTGNVTSCCYNRKFVLGTYPQQSLREIWNGAAAHELRDVFLHNKEARGCDLCFHQLQSGNFAGSLMANFDPFSERDGYRAAESMPAPRVLEFEIANTCNLECVMCGGRWSSSIRARREKLPPLRNPYDRAFVEQLEEFLPSIAHAKFLGGEPFLIRRYYEIWERIRRLNPKARVSITTNATFLPDRAKEILEELRADIIISLDAATAETYESIRRNARFDVVMEHLDYLHAYTQRRGTGLTLAVCPMTSNWRELHRVIELCEARQVGLHFNMVIRPIDASLVSFTTSELSEVARYLEGIRPTGDASWSVRNREQLVGLTQQVVAWREEKAAFADRARTLMTNVRRFAHEHLSSPHGAMREGVDRLIEPVTFAYLVGQELSNVTHWDLRNLLPQPPLSLWPNGEHPGAKELLLTGQILAQYLDALTDAKGADDTMVVAELASAQQFLAMVGKPGGPPSHRLEQLGAWLANRLELAESEKFIAAMREFSNAMHPASAHEDSFDSIVRRRLPEAFETLRAAVHDDRRCAMARSLVYERLRDKFGAVWLLVDGGPELTDDSAYTLEPNNLRTRLDALYLCCLCMYPSGDPVWFGARIAEIHDTLEQSGSADLACRAFDDAGIERSLRYLTDTPEDDLGRALRDLMSS